MLTCLVRGRRLILCTGMESWASHSFLLKSLKLFPTPKSGFHSDSDATTLTRSNHFRDCTGIFFSASDIIALVGTPVCLYCLQTSHSAMVLVLPRVPSSICSSERAFTEKTKRFAPYSGDCVLHNRAMCCPQEKYTKQRKKRKSEFITRRRSLLSSFETAGQHDQTIWLKMLYLKAHSSV